ncbi:MAG: iron-sulfur cluster assembly protein [Rhodospirillales bacterium]|nr:iron-sulfur cluster assembly protein [Rhodospirillales bacterium]MDE0378786.1 iron-sulfur cluster assembly protein [Rhodospirillales bacterium]
MSGQEGMREAEVLARLATVTDPELDEPVTDLGFVEGVSVGADGAVAIDFRLPTFWCAANFAYMMAEDMRDAVAALPWVTGVVPRLQAHMCAEQVNRGVAEGLEFGAAFGEAGEDDSLADLRATFLRKAFQGRQEALLRALLAQGLGKGALAAMTLAALEGTAVAGPEGARLKCRYLEMRARVGGPAGSGDRAFVTADGAPINAACFDEHLRTLGSVRIAMEFNGALCRGLLAARERASGG